MCVNSYIALSDRDFTKHYYAGAERVCATIPIPYLQHLPFVENYVCEHTASPSTERFTFTGKERDPETGYTYHGAGYFDVSLLCSWFSVAPLSDKYQSLRPYNYCAWNPVKLVDLDGREVDWYLNTQTGNYSWFNGSSEHAGYEHIGGKGSLLGEYEPIIENIQKESGHEGLYKDGLTLDITASDKGALIGSKDGGWDFLDEFISGTGPEISILTDKHPYTQDVKNHPIVTEWQQKSDSKSMPSLFYHINMTEGMNHNRGNGSKSMSNTYQINIWNSPVDQQY